MSAPPAGDRARRAVARASSRCIWVAPYAWMTLTSLKTLARDRRALRRYPLPEASLSSGAYREVFDDACPSWRYFVNTVVMAVAIALLQIALALPAGYALAKLRFVGQADRLRAWCSRACSCRRRSRSSPSSRCSGDASPGEHVRRAGAAVRGERARHLPRAAGAARRCPTRSSRPRGSTARASSTSSTGCSRRCSGPRSSSLFLFSFVFHYNDYFWPLVMTTDDTRAHLPLGIALLREQGTGVRWHIVMAGNVILSARCCVVFALAQKHLVRAVSGKGL